MVKVSKALCEELTKIKNSGIDCQDKQIALQYAENSGLMLAARTIRGNPRRYLACINEGMEVCED
jgi:hypothetical protein